VQFIRHEDGSLVLSEIDPALRSVLDQIPYAADPLDNAAARERLYPEPATGADASGIREEWNEYVRPELHAWFHTAVDVVIADLQKLDEKGELLISAAHVDAWLNALNQARLSLAARHNVTEADMDRQMPYVLKNDRDYALFQIHIYGLLQEYLVRGINEETREL